MSLSKVESALTQEYINLALNIPTSYPNVSFTPPTEGIWGNLTFNPTVTTPVAAFNGQDNHDGFLQIDFSIPQDTATSVLRYNIDLIQAHFTAGKSFVYLGQAVTITATQISPGRRVDNYYRISATIQWYARTQRN